MRQEGEKEGFEKGLQKGINEGIEKGIEIFISDNLEEGKSRQQIIEKLVKRFGLSENDAIMLVEKHMEGLKDVYKRQGILRCKTCAMHFPNGGDGTAGGWYRHFPEYRA